MEKSPTQTDYDHVNLILYSAEEYGLKWEVEHTAQNYLKEHPDKSLKWLLSVYHKAHKSEWETFKKHPKFSI